MAPLQRFHQLWSLNLLDDLYAETDEGFDDLQVPPTVPLQDQSSLDTKPITTATIKSVTKKSVSFALSNDICIIENKTLLPEEEKAAIWYEKRDFHRFKDSCRRIIEWISSRNQYSLFGAWDQQENNDEEESKYCMRGLERHTREGTAKYIQRDNAKWNDLMVLRMTGATPEEIATIMVQHSLPCIAEAQDRARQDALTAWRYQHESPTSATTFTKLAQPKHVPDTWPNMLPIIRAIRDHVTLD